MWSQKLNPADIVDLGVPNYCHGLHLKEVNEWVQLSGQVGVAPDGTVAENFDEQCRQAFSNIDACLRQAGMGPQDIAMLRIFLISREHLGALRKIRKEYLGDLQIPSTLVFVSGLVGPNWLVELEVTAAKG